MARVASGEGRGASHARRALVAQSPLRADDAPDPAEPGWGVQAPPQAGAACEAPLSSMAPAAGPWRGPPGLKRHSSGPGGRAAGGPTGGRADGSSVGRSAGPSGGPACRRSDGPSNWSGGSGGCLWGGFAGRAVACFSQRSLSPSPSPSPSAIPHPPSSSPRSPPPLPLPLVAVRVVKSRKQGLPVAELVGQ